MQARFYLIVFLVLFFADFKVFCQQNKDSILYNKGVKDSMYITRLDTLLHLQSWISKNQLEYTLVYNKDFKIKDGFYFFSDLSNQSNASACIFLSNLWGPG